ncbi:MAG TPA: DinB family protein [Dongiaceae bacterium]|nr:DinB family protein [Dongiaceae bacterium]
MSGMTAEQAVFALNTFFLDTLKKEGATTKKILAAVPADQADYRPDANAKSARELLRHIATADNFFIEAVLNGVFNPAATQIPETVKTPAEVAEWYEKRHAANLESLAKLPGEQLTKIVDFRGMFELPAIMFLQFGLVHAIHHRGQLSTYLRPMGAKVPAIYGESYDSAQAKKAAQGTS